MRFRDFLRPLSRENAKISSNVSSSSSPAPKPALDWRNFETNSAIPFNRENFRRLDVIEKLNCMLEYPTYVNYVELEYLFQRNPIANRVCTTLPRYCWNPRPIVLELNNTTNQPQTDFEKICAAIAQKVSLYEYFERADVAAQIGQYGVMYVSFTDANKGAPPPSAKPKIPNENPITGAQYNEQPPSYTDGLGQVDWKSLEGKGADAIKYVVPYQQGNAWPTMYVTNYSEPCFALVDYYNLQSGGQVFGSNQQYNIVYGGALPVTWNVVHSSRVIHVCDRNIGNNILGVPALLPIFNDLINLTRVGGGAAMSFQYNARGGLAISIKQENNQSINQSDVNTLQVQIDNYLAGYNRVIACDGMTVTPINFEIASPDKHVETYLQNISAGCGIPLRILMGNEAGRLASDQDAKNFDKLIKSRQEGYCVKLVRMFFDPLIANGVIPKPKNGAYKVHFPTLDIADDSVNAASFNQIGMALSALANSTSPELENEIQSFINKAKEILKIKDDNVDLTVPDTSFKSPDLRAEDLVEAARESDEDADTI